ncbi:MAG: DNA repair protein RadA [Candidatus Nanopelagicales bacterium]
MASSSASRLAFRCSECGWQSVKWVGRCGQCQAWGSVAEAVGIQRRAPAAGPVCGAAVPMTLVDLNRADHAPTGVAEVDRVLGGGIVPGGVVLLAGEPGVGKSTLLLQVVASVARAGGRALYLTGEESVEQVRARAQRVGAVSESVFLAAEQDVSAVVSHAESVSPQLLVVDSIQTMTVGGVDGVASGVAQVREAAAALIRLAKDRRMACVLVGHVTKDGGIAGPRTLEHLVDVVLSFEGDRHARLRMLRAVKNRYGPTDEVGCFELGENGLADLPDPSGLFLSDRPEPVPGTCVTVTLEGRRPLMAEIQALVVPSGGNGPRRTTAGMDSARMAMVLAVLERREVLAMSRYDTYLAPVGGARLVEPAIDLAAALAVFSSVRDMAVPTGWVALGEVGLAGDVRRVTGVRQRVAEAARLGICDVLLPRADAADVRSPGVRLHPVDDIGGALRLLPWVRPDLTTLVRAVGPRALTLIPEL